MNEVSRAVGWGATALIRAAFLLATSASCRSEPAAVDAGAPSASTSSSLPFDLPGDSVAPPRYDCATGITTRAAKGKDDLVFRLERTMCLGTCPAYEVFVYADGRVHLDDPERIFDPPPDRWIAREAVEKLVQRFRDARFFELCDTPRGGWTDHPSIELDFWDGGRDKSVKTYLGNPIAPALVRDLAKQIDAAVDIDSFRTAPPRPPPSASGSGRSTPPRPCSPCDMKDPLCDCPSTAAGDQ